MAPVLGALKTEKFMEQINGPLGIKKEHCCSLRVEGQTYSEETCPS